MEEANPKGTFMKIKATLAVLAILLTTTSAFAQQTQSAETRVTLIPGGQQIDVITTTTGVFSPRVTVVTSYLQLGNLPPTLIGRSDAHGQSPAGSFLAPVINAAGFVSGMAALRPPKFEDNSSSSTNVSAAGGTGNGGIANPVANGGSATNTATANPVVTAEGGSSKSTAEGGNAEQSAYSSNYAPTSAYSGSNSSNYAPTSSYSGASNYAPDNSYTSAGASNYTPVTTNASSSPFVYTEGGSANATSVDYNNSFNSSNRTTIDASSHNCPGATNINVGSC